MLLISSSAIFSSIGSNLLLSPPSKFLISQLSKTSCCALLLCPMPWLLNGLQAEKQSNKRIHLMYPPFLRGQSLQSLFLVQCLNTTVTWILSDVLIVLSRMASLISVSPSRPAAKISSCAIFGNAKLENLCRYFRPVFIFLSHYFPIIY